MLRRAHDLLQEENFFLRQQDRSLESTTTRLEASVERERFLLEELEDINERLLCKSPIFMFYSSALLV